MRVKIKSKSIGLLLLISVFTLALGLQSKPANAAWPGQNGKIAYTSATIGGEGPVSSVYSNTVNGGSEQVMIESEEYPFIAPRFSADGEQVTYTAFFSFNGEGGDIYVADADGTGSQNVTNIVPGDFPDRENYGAIFSSFNNDGSRLTYGEYWREDFEQNCYIFTVAANGTDKQQLTSNSDYCDIYPVYSPDGSQIAFLRLDKQANEVAIYTMNANGSGVTHIHDLRVNGTVSEFPFDVLNSPVLDRSAGSTIDWSPSGEGIVFTDLEYEPIGEDQARIHPSIKQTDLAGNSTVLYDVEYIFDPEDPGTTPEEILIFSQPQYMPEGGIIFRAVGVNYTDQELTVYLNTVSADGTNLQNVESSATYDMTSQEAGMALLELLMPTVQPLEDDEEESEPGDVTLVNPENGKDIILSQTACDEFSATSAVAESSLAAQDDTYQYPSSLVNFTVEGCQVGGDTTITLVFAGLNGDPSSYAARKYNPNTEEYFDIPSATITSTTHNSEPAIQLVYTITDGGLLDMDGEANGEIIDPVGLGFNPLIAAMLVAQQTTTANQDAALAQTGVNSQLGASIAAGLIGTSLLVLWYRKFSAKRYGTISVNGKKR